MEKLLKKGAVGAVVYLHKMEAPEPNQITPPTLQILLNQFSDVFEEPTQLPPQPLQLGAEIINTGPYRLSHHQKDTMEALIL
jgi:hypothetical protein